MSQSKLVLLFIIASLITLVGAISGAFAFYKYESNYFMAVVLFVAACVNAAFNFGLYKHIMERSNASI